MKLLTSVEQDSHTFGETFLPVPKPPKTKNVPYVKRFDRDDNRIINGGILKCTASSTKQWQAPR